ncbi:MAG: transposase, partial [Chloroflexi bacterium]|nr:transposase [Chloroflexota bacterium]
SQRISGSSVRGKSHMCKIGDAHLRKYLYLPAIVAMTHDPPMQALRARLLNKGKHHMAINVAAMRKLLCVAIGVLKSGKPYDPAWASALPLAP